MPLVLSVETKGGQREVKKVEIYKTLRTNKVADSEEWSLPLLS